MRILVIEDEIKINKMISDYLKYDGYEVISAFDGLEGVEKFFLEDKINMVILDIMLPRLDGFSVLERIRKESTVPVIMLTARGAKEDILKGYSLMVDDYIVKPFNMEVLVAKINVMLNRVNNIEEVIIKDKNEHIELKGVKLDKKGLKVFIGEEEIQLERKQIELLEYFMENKNIVISRESLLDNIWGVDFLGNDRVVDAQIKKLRKKLKHKAYLIRTVFGVGYKFDEE